MIIYAIRNKIGLIFMQNHALRFFSTFNDSLLILIPNIDPNVYQFHR